jgi:starvation-inducible DNA-binding protein
MKTNIGLNEETRKSVVDILNALNADAHVLYIKTRNYHWNVTGPEFHSLHLLLEKQYEAMAESIDEIAERARSLHGHAVGTMGEFLKIARLKEEKPGTYPPSTQMVMSLIADHETVIRQLREDVDRTANECHDMGTSDMLTGLMESHEKMVWMLRSFVEGESVQSGK